MNAYKSYEVLTTELRMSVKMHLNILRGIFMLHLVLVLVVLVLTIANLPPPEQVRLQQIVSQHFWTLRNHDLPETLKQAGQLPSFLALKQHILMTFAVYLLWPTLVFAFHRRTNQRFRLKTVRGSHLITEAELRQQLQTSGPRLQLTGNLAVPSSFEPRQFFISGAPGTGKTTLISGVIADLKRRRAKGLVYDAKAGEFVARFYNAKTDLIYNPFDARSVHWNFFEMLEAEGSMITALDTLAAALIPEERSTQAQFFVDTARKTLSAILQYCYVSERRSVKQLAAFLSGADLHGRLMQVLEQVDAKLCTFIAKAGSGQTQGVLSVLSQHTRVLNYMVESPGQPQLSLHDWLTDNKPGLIFLPNAADQKETLKAVFSFFINCMATTMLSLRDDAARRVFFLLDEVGTLERMHAIFELIKLGRSKGACFFLGIQEKSQLDHLYGEHMANSIINHCNNHIIFRCNDNYTAQYASNLLGEAEQEGMESSYSAGYKEFRDRESYHRSQRLDRLVLPSQIQTLPDLQFYLKLHGLPVAQCALPYRGFPDITDAFVPNQHFLARNLKLQGTTNGQIPQTDASGQQTIDLQPDPPVKHDYPLDDLSF